MGALLAMGVPPGAQERQSMKSTLTEAGVDFAHLYEVGSERQLFVDDVFLEHTEGVTLKLHPPRKTGEKNVQREHAWESATLNWFTVMDDGGTLRMWYECYDVDGWPTGDDTSFCYAESNDGVRWRKPELGIFSYGGSTRNNILFRMIGPDGCHSRVHGTCVFRDPTAAPEARYRAVSQGLWPAMDPIHRIAGMVSPDGLRWTRYPEPICSIMADSQYSAFWDPSIGSYVIYGRVGGRGRALGRAQNKNFSHFEPLELVLEANDDDPVDSDLYNPAALKYPHAANVYFMFPSLFQHGPQTLDVRLAVSRDGIHWTRPGRRPFIPLGEQGEFDSGSLYMGQGLIRRGGELWQYYGGSRLRHDESRLELLQEPGGSRTYSRVVSRLDGYVSVDAGPEAGFFETPPLIFTGSRLELNVQVREGGEVRVGLMNETGEHAEGCAVRDCVPVTGDHLAAEVKWDGRTDLRDLTGKPTKMRVAMKSASLYAFRFAP